MENPPHRRHRFAWLALVTAGTLLLLPATRPLLRTQLKMEAPTYSTQTDPAAERAAAAHMPDDYPVQLALATPMAPLFTGTVPTHTDFATQSRERSQRIEALAQRFPNNPSVYANLLRYMIQGEVHVMRAEASGALSSPATHFTPTPTSPESLAMFEAAALKGAQLDPDNAYFPMMHAVSLFNTHHDADALDALKTAGRCTRWSEYYQDEAEGQKRLYTAAYGDQSALQHVTIAFNILFPQYAQFRDVARVAVCLAMQAEAAGNPEAGLAIRHAVMRSGGLMRAQGTSYITTLVGLAITNIATSCPGGSDDPQFRFNDLNSLREDTLARREQRCQNYYAYLERLGKPQEVVWAKTEISAGEQVRAIGAEGRKTSFFEDRSLYRLALCWLANLALLSSALVLLVLGAASALAGSVRPRKALWVWRSAYALLIMGGIGLWQWQAMRNGMNPYGQVQSLFSGTPVAANGSEGMTGRDQALQCLTSCLGLLAPALLVGLIAGMARFQRVPLATGVGRGLRGAALPAAAVLFLIYGASLLPTARAESVVKAAVADTMRSEPQRFAATTHKVWPGDPQP